jgi:hypothetical protein
MTHSRLIGQILKRVAPAPSNVITSSLEGIRTVAHLSRHRLSMTREPHSRLQQLHDYAKTHLGRDKVASQENVNELCQLMSESSCNDRCFPLKQRQHNSPSLSYRSGSVPLEELGFDSSILEVRSVGSLLSIAPHQMCPINDLCCAP